MKLRNLVGGECQLALGTSSSGAEPGHGGRHRIGSVGSEANVDRAVKPRPVGEPEIGFTAERVLAIESIRAGNPVGDPGLGMGRSSPRQVKHVMAKLG